MIIKNAIWCLIPARSGSKTLKNKNIRILGKYPLFVHSFITAKKIKKISRIYLSTDSVKYKNIANKYNFKDIHIRSKKNSGDNSSDLDVFKEFLNYIIKNYLKIPEFIIHFRPTIPLRNPKNVILAINSFLRNKRKYSSLKSVSKFKTDNYKNSFIIKKKRLVPLAGPTKGIDYFNLPRQNYPVSYFGNGIVDIYKTKNILFKNTLYGKNVLPYVIEDPSYDIDTLDDFKNVKKFYEIKKINS